MDLGRPKNQSFENLMKRAPTSQDGRADFSHIFFSKNGHRMQKLWRYEVQVKWGKSQSQ
jgi:hypothetical protein